MKLVRDNIPAIILEKQPNCAYAECKDHEFLKRLLENKLLEEVNEFIDSEVLPEAADVITVLYYLYLEGIKDYGGELITFDQFLDSLKKVAKEKIEINGGFEKGYILFNRGDYSND
jgi:predicted house-cleaning noncanonical NTP pyrophosphatase (MazG superfamily)